MALSNNLWFFIHRRLTLPVGTKRKQNNLIFNKGGGEIPPVKNTKNFMKKLLYTLAGLSALALFASCNKEAERPASPEGEVVTATFTVAAPEGVATKAISDGATATNLIVAVYDETDKYLEELSTHATISGGTPTWNVSMKVVKDMTYRFVFLAKSASDNGFSTFTPATGKLAIDYSKLSANNDNADFFFVQDKFKVENSFSKTEDMHRPLAQVNFGASDLTAAAYSIKTDNTMLTGVTLTGIHSEMSVLTGNVTSTAADVTFTQSARVPAESPKFVDGYDRIAMVYALVATDQANVTATLNVTAKGAKNDDNHIITREIANVPLKRNYRTNILGNIFTNDFNFTVNTVPGFYTPDSNKLIGPSFASVADLNAYFATFKGNADNGDVDPEIVTLTAFASGEENPTIILPEYAGKVQIRIPVAHNDTDKGNVTLAYPDPHTAAPARLELYAANLKGLAGSITETHLTILEASHITTTTVSTSSTTLEVRPKAVIGTLNIDRGNVEIAGEVSKVDVRAGATADGENPVQVFVSKEAAIETITLNAQTDVVVEQPKDQITKDETERKVAVYVKEGADNSTAKAQNGGVIYVKADVPCAVTVDGTSEAEDGSAVSSTVIIDSGAAGSTVTAENGGTINLTANGNCEVTASGSSTPEDPTDTPVPSSVVIDKVTSGADVHTETEGDATVEPAPDADIDGDIIAYVAKIGEVKYETFDAALAAAKTALSSSTPVTIDIIHDCDALEQTEFKFYFSKELIINGGDYVITHKKSNGRIFKLFGPITLTLNGGHYVTNDYNTYGFIDMRDVSGSATSGTKVIANGTTFEGGADLAGLICARADNQEVELNNVTVNCTGGNTYSIVNGWNVRYKLTINGGTYTYHSTYTSAGVFQAGMFSKPSLADNTTVVFDGVTVNTTSGPVLEGHGNVTIKNCNFQDPNAESQWVWCNSGIAAAIGGTVTVDGGSYKGNNAVFVYNSGGTITINGGSFEGNQRAISIDNNTNEASWKGPSIVNISGGSFNGPIVLDAQGTATTDKTPSSTLNISGGTFTVASGNLFTITNLTQYCHINITGGTFSQDPSAYVAQGYSALDNGDGTWTVIEGVIYYHSEEDTQDKGNFDNFIKTLPDGTKVLLTPGYYIGSQISGHNQVHEQNLTLAGFGDGVVFQGPGDGVSSTRGRYGLRLRSYADGDATPDHHEVTLKDMKIIGGYEPNWSSWMPALYCRGNLTANLKNVVLESNNDVALEFDVTDDFMANAGVYAEVNLDGVTIQAGKKINVSGDGTAATVTITYANCTNIDAESFTCTGCENVTIYVNGVELNH